MLNKINPSVFLWLLLHLSHFHKSRKVIENFSMFLLFFPSGCLLNKLVTCTQWPSFHCMTHWVQSHVSTSLIKVSQSQSCSLHANIKSSSRVCFLICVTGFAKKGGLLVVWFYLSFSLSQTALEQSCKIKKEGGGGNSGVRRA